MMRGQIGSNPISPVAILPGCRTEASSFIYNRLRLRRQMAVWPFSTKEEVESLFLSATQLQTIKALNALEPAGNFECLLHKASFQKVRVQDGGWNANVLIKSDHPTRFLASYNDGCLKVNTNSPGYSKFLRWTLEASAIENENLEVATLAGFAFEKLSTYAQVAKVCPHLIRVMSTKYPLSSYEVGGGLRASPLNYNDNVMSSRAASVNLDAVADTRPNKAVVEAFQQKEELVTTVLNQVLMLPTNFDLTDLKFWPTWVY